MENEFIANPQLDGGPIQIEGGKTGILFLHGFTATTTDIRSTALYFANRGFTVHAPLLPGHGTHPDELNHTRWQDWYAAAELAYQGLIAHCAAVWVAGDSMGGLLSVLLAADHAEVKGLVLQAPAVVLRSKYAWMAPFVYPFARFQPKPVSKDNLLWKGYTVNPTRGVSQLLKLQRVVRRRLGEVTQPVLVCEAGKDATVDPVSMQLILDGVSSIVKELVIFPQSPHVMALGPEQEAVARTAYAFVEANS